MSYEILNKTSNGFDITVNDEDQAKTEEFVDDDETNEELKASIDNLIFKKHITPKDRHVQKLNSELLSSIQQDDMETFVRCLQEGANPSAVCRETGLSACHVAILCERCHLLEKLLKAGANDSFPSWHNGYLPIHVAAWKECLNCLKMLVNNTRSNTSVVNSTNLCDITSISQSILDSWHHHHKVLNSEMPPVYEKCTPLHIVCKKLNFRCAEYLLEERADTEAVDGRGMAPLDVVYEVIMATNASDRSVYNESYKKSTTDLARSRTSSITTIQDFNRRQLHDFIEIKMESDDASKIISSLIDYDSKFKAATSSSGNLAIMEKCKSFLFPATITQNEKLLKILLAKNVDLSIRNENGDTILHFAVRHRLKRSLFILLKSEKIKPILEMRDIEFKTPLHIAVSCMWIDGTSALLESGANVTAITNNGDTTLHCAARTTNTCILDGLFTYHETEKIKDYKNDNEETAIMVAVMSSNLACVRKLMNFGVCLRISGQHNRTLVHVAADNGFSRILKLILREDLDLKEARTDDNETAIHLAAKGGHLECLQYLLSIGCCETAVTITVSSSFDENFDFGGTALHYAAWKGHLPIIQALVDCNKDLVNVANVNKWFPLHVAMYFNHADCADFLIKHGANLSYRVPYADDTLRSGFDILSYTFTDPSLFLERVFDCFIEKNDLPLTHLDSCIILKFDPLTPNGSGRKQMKVLNALLNNENEPFQRQVLLHPLIEIFLYLKWKKLRPFFNFTTLLYAFFIVTQTLFGIYVDEPSSTTTSVILVLMLASLIPLSVLEVLHARKLQRYYVKDLESWLKWFTYGMTLLFGSRAAYLAIVGYGHSPWNDMIVIPVLFAWIEALFLLSRYPTWGFCILMFFRVAIDVIRVFCTFSPLILGFVFSFYIFFKSEADSPFYTLQETFVRTIAMVSEYEYSDTFHKSDNLLRDVIARFLFLLFVVLIAIVLVNLMVGLAVSDIATLQAQGRSKTLAKQIDFLYMLESLVYNENLLDWLPQNIKAWITEHRNIPSLYVIYPNRPFDKKTTELPTELKRFILSKVSSRIELKYGVSRNHAEIAKKLQLLSQELDFIHKELFTMESGSILTGH